jgi:F0F1-type ATP synthase assembly protein I
VPEDKQPRTPRRFNYRKLAALSSLGLMLPSSIAVGLFIGYLLDRLLGTHPWLLAVFTLLGVTSGFLSLIRGLKKLGVERDKEDEDNE